MNRRLFIVMAVIGFHVLGLWALQAGLLRRAVELVIPVNVMAEFIEAPQPQVTPAPPQPEPRPEPVQKQRPAPQPRPQPVAIAEPAPAPEAPAGTTEPPPPAEPLTAAMSQAEAPPALPPAPPPPLKIELPSSDAAYLSNPLPPYPSLSKRLREEGTAWIRAYIEVNGTASKAEIFKSSGYARLDQTALQTALKWRYVPGKRAGVPEAMWVNVPIRFDLE